MSLGGLPPWLEIHPSDFVRAAQMGAEAGLQVARMNQAAQEAAAARAQRADESAADRALRQFEHQQQMELRAQEIAAEREKSKDAMDSRMAYNMANLELREKSQKDREAANEAINTFRQKSSELAAQRLKDREDQFQERQSLAQAAEDRRLEEANRRSEEAKIRDQLQRDLYELKRDKKAVFHYKNEDGSTLTGTLDDPEVAAMHAKRTAPAAPGLLSRIGTGLANLIGGGDETGGIQPIGQAPTGTPTAPENVPSPALSFPSPGVPPMAAPSFRRAPVDPEEREAGTVYMTSKKGPALWNGKAWEPYTPGMPTEPTAQESDSSIPDPGADSAAQDAEPVPPEDTEEMPSEE